MPTVCFYKSFYCWQSCMAKPHASQVLLWRFIRIRGGQCDDFCCVTILCDLTSRGDSWSCLRDDVMLGFFCDCPIFMHLVQVLSKCFVHLNPTSNAISRNTDFIGTNFNCYCACVFVVWFVVLFVVMHRGYWYLDEKNCRWLPSSHGVARRKSPSSVEVNRRHFASSSSIQAK